MDFNLLSSCIIKSSRCVHDTHDAAIAHAASKCGLTKSEADVLLFLYNHPDCNTARDVAYYRGFSKAYVSKAIEPLTHRGLLAIQADPTDRRRQLLTITGDSSIVKRLHDAQLEFLKLLVQGMSEAELICFMDVTQRMCQNALRSKNGAAPDDAGRAAM